MEDKYNVKITTPNFKIYIKGKAVRCPTEFVAFEKELDLIKSQCHRGGASIEISPYTPVYKVNSSETEIEEMIETKPIIEELYDSTKPKTTLEKLLRNEEIELEKE